MSIIIVHYKILSYTIELYYNTIKN
jgi:hypothetical protein